MIILPLTKLGMVGSNLESNGLSVLHDNTNTVDIQLIFLLFSNVSELGIELKAKRFCQSPLPVKYILLNKELSLFSDICETLFC